MSYSSHLRDAVLAAIKAGAAIMDVYASDFAVETKEDHSPLTLADKKSHEIIKAELSRHDLPFISEEGRYLDYGERSRWSLLWIVDPLDGTKEFIKRNGEFTVNIALIEDRQPVMGVVYAPVNQWLYFAARDLGAYKMIDVEPAHFTVNAFRDVEDQLHLWMQQASRLPLDSSERSAYTIVGSRSHGTSELEAFVRQKRRERGEVEFIAAGSSLKICLVAEGSADIYPRLGPTMEWDTAAGQAIAEFSGARVYVYQGGETLGYNRRDMLNPWFIVER